MLPKSAAAALGGAAIVLFTAGLADAQLVSSDEARARRGCIDEAGARGWLVQEVVGLRALGSARYDVALRASRDRRETELACSWDGRRATVSEGTRPVAPGLPSPSATLCERAVGDRVEADARRLGFRSGDVRLRTGRPFPTTSGEEGLLGEGEYRFGSRGFERMTWECRVNTRSGVVASARYEPHAGGATRRLVCESRDSQARTCPARVAGDVRVLRRRSSARCDEGQSWWWTLDGITVTSGCRAEFEYREQTARQR